MKYYPEDEYDLEELIRRHSREYAKELLDRKGAWRLWQILEENDLAYAEWDIIQDWLESDYVDEDKHVIDYDD